MYTFSKKCQKTLALTHIYLILFSSMSHLWICKCNVSVPWESGDHSSHHGTDIPKEKEENHVSKKIAKVVKMELPGGEAKPGPKLASAGVVMPKFCTDFNAKTADRKGEIVPVIITAYEDKSHGHEMLVRKAGIIVQDLVIAEGDDVVAVRHIALLEQTLCLVQNV